MIHKFKAKQLNRPATQALVAVLVLLLGAGQTLVFSVRAQGSRSRAPKQKNSKLSDDRRAALVLSRLTFALSTAKRWVNVGLSIIGYS